jgi:hypothetical protein
MNVRSLRPLAVASTALLALSGCSFLGPERDANGQVVETSVIGSTRLLVGDCFSFVDGTNLADASVTPCDEEHSYIVIGAGSLTASTIDSAGGLQNAVSASCSADFETVKASRPEGVRPEQEFIVWTVEQDGETLTNYSCVATDSVTVSAER